MRYYDPEQAPKAAEWLALDKQERIDLAETFHRKTRIEVPDVRMHATIHAVIKNQIAEAHEPVVRAMYRLTSTGLTRHDALHAIGSVLAEHIFNLLGDETANQSPTASYDAAVERLTAESWRHG